MHGSLGVLQFVNLSKDITGWLKKDGVGRDHSEMKYFRSIFCPFLGIVLQCVRTIGIQFVLFFFKFIFLLIVIFGLLFLLTHDLLILKFLRAFHCFLMPLHYYNTFNVCLFAWQI